MKMLEEIYCYRMVHIKNMVHILENGITHRNSKNANPTYLAIGDVEVINTRESKIVEVTNGSTEILETFTLGEYIPFYFGVRMPMLLVIQSGWNNVKSSVNPEEIVYLAVNLKTLVDLGKNYYFSDGHATDAFSVFYNKHKIEDITKILNWEAIKGKYWGGDGNLNRKRKMQAEFLISGDLPFSVLHGYVCYNQSAKNILINLGIDKEKIKVKPECYY